MTHSRTSSPFTSTLLAKRTAYFSESRTRYSRAFGGDGLADPSFAGDSAWQKGCITTGAWREDDEDVVFHYDILPGLNYALTSITHFWDADQGDYTQNMFRLLIEQPYPIPPLSTDIGPYHNTFDKIMQFAHGESVGVELSPDDLLPEHV